jgi:hypothetical protein
MIGTTPAPAAAFALSDRFWDDFVARSWGRRPCVIRDPFPAPLVDEAELVAILTAAASEYRAFQRLVSLAVFVDGACLLADVDRFLPHAAVRSLDDYRAQLETLAGDRAVMVTVAGLQNHAFDLWTRARWFLRPLFKRVGFAAHSADLDTFFGRYDQSPGGVHTDTAANFSYVLSDRKTMLFWPSSYFANRVPPWATTLRTMDYRPYAHDALVLEARHGDVIFWPRDYWHVGVSDGGWPTTVTLALYQKTSPHDVLAPILASTSAALTTPVDAFGAPPEAESPAELPSALRDAARLYREGVAGEELVRAAQRQWLRRASASGFASVPPPAELAALDDGDRLSAAATGPLLLTHREGGTLSIGANGHLVDVADAAHLAACAELVRGGVAGTVAEIVAACASDAAAAAETRQLLLDLCRVRALHVTDRG